MEQKEKKPSARRIALFEKLRNTPKEKLSKAAQWLLKQEDSEEKYWIDESALV